MSPSRSPAAAAAATLLQVAAVGSGERVPAAAALWLRRREPVPQEHGVAPRAGLASAFAAPASIGASVGVSLFAAAAIGAVRPGKGAGLALQGRGCVPLPPAGHCQAGSSLLSLTSNNSRQQAVSTGSE
jgi:hypothetical protein